jgi:hypothetical protein
VQASLFDEPSDEGRVDEATWASASGVMDEIRRKFGGDAIRTVAALRDAGDLGEVGESPWGPASPPSDTR